jgi:coenzyme F420-reducing hydrogenase beta subunit
VLKPGVIIAMALGCCACASVDNSSSISRQWVGRWAEESRFCNDPASESWDLIITPQALSFRNERGTVRSAYTSDGSLLVVVADDSGLATQYRSYALSKSPTGEAVAVVLDTKTFTLQRCPAGS